MMGNWNHIKFSKIAKITKGISYISSDYCNEGEGAIFVTLKCIAKAGGFSQRGIKYFKGFIPKKQLIKKGDLLFANTDLTRNGDIVGCPVYLPDLGNDFSITMSMDLSRVDFIDENIDPEFIYYQLMTDRVRKFMKENSSGSTVLHLNTSKVYDLELNIPASKPEQTHIAEILNTADTAIAQTEALIAKYQRIKTGLMQDLLTRGIDADGNIRSKATHRFVVKNGIEVPEEWEVYTIDDIAEHVGSGITPKGGSNVYGHSGVMLIRSQNVLIGEFDFNDVAFISEEINQRMKRSELQDFDVLLNITGASIGRSHFIPVNFPKSNVNQHVCAIRLKNKTEGKSIFLSNYLNDFKGQTQIKRLLGASNREGLNYQQIREIKSAMPNIGSNGEFERIQNMLSAINDNIQSAKISLSKLHSLKTGLMQDLLSGRVRVKEKPEQKK